MPIPDGLRDAREARDEKITSFLASQPGARVLIREAFDGQAVVLKLAPLLAGEAEAPCDRLAAEIAAADHATVSGAAAQAFGEDRGCAWTATAGKVTMATSLRFHGGQQLLVGCTAGIPCAPILAGITTSK